MSIDLRARTATDALARATERDVDVPLMLDQLHQRHQHRGGLRHDGRVRLRSIALVAAAAVVLVLALLRGSWHPTAAVPAAPHLLPSAARSAFQFAAPFTAVRPPGWSDSLEPKVEVAIESPTGPYVKVVMSPSPLGTPTSPAPARLTAASVAAWLAARPELEPTTAVRTVVSGLPAWRVDLALRPGAATRDSCDGSGDGCLALFRVPGVTEPLGVAAESVGRAFFVQLPDGRIVGITTFGTWQDCLPTIEFATQPVIQSINFTAVHA
jgi:hypothetical protein